MTTYSENTKNDKEKEEDIYVIWDKETQSWIPTDTSKLQDKQDKWIGVIP